MTINGHKKIMEERETALFQYNYFYPGWIISEHTRRKWNTYPEVTRCAWCYLLGLYLGDAAAVRERIR